MPSRHVNSSWTTSRRARRSGRRRRRPMANTGSRHEPTTTLPRRAGNHRTRVLPSRLSASLSNKVDSVMPQFPLYPHGHLAILEGNLATEGAVAKITGLKSPKITGPARVFDSEEACMAAILAKKIHSGDVIVIRYEGPKGGPGMREMLSPTSALVGEGHAA